MKFRICIRRVFIFAVILSLFLTIFHNSKFRINKQISIASQLLESKCFNTFVWKGVCEDIEVLKSAWFSRTRFGLFCGFRARYSRYGIGYRVFKAEFSGFQLKISTNSNQSYGYHQVIQINGI